MFAGILGRWAFRDRLTPGWWLSTTLGSDGLRLDVRGKSASPDRTAGVALALGAGTSYALLGLGIKKASREGSPTVPVAAALLAGSLMLVPSFWSPARGCRGSLFLEVRSWRPIWASSPRPFRIPSSDGP